MRRLLVFALAFCLISAPFTAHAGIFGEENGPLSALVGLTTQLVAQGDVNISTNFKQAITVATDMLKTTNATFEVVRSTYNLYRTVRDYTTDQLLRDIQDGLIKSYPGITDMMAEYDGFQANVKSTQNRTFFDIETRWTPKMETFYNSMATHFAKSVVFPTLAPDWSANLGWKPSSVEKVFYASLIDAGLTSELKSEAFKRAFLGEKAYQLCHDAEKKQSSADMTSCLNILMAMDQSQDIKDMALLAKLKQAKDYNAEVEYNRTDQDRRRLYEEERAKAPTYKDLFERRGQPLSPNN